MKCNPGARIFLALLLVFAMVSFAMAQMGMKYLTPDQFPKYNKMLKNYGRGDLKTTVAVVTNINDQERVGLKCINKKGKQYQVFITDGKIVRINKVKTLSRAEKRKLIEDTAREMTNRGMTPPKNYR